MNNLYPFFIILLSINVIDSFLVQPTSTPRTRESNTCRTGVDKFKNDRLISHTKLNVVYTVSEDKAKDYVNNSEMIIVVPTFALNLEQMNAFKRSVLGGTIYEVIQPCIMIKALDRTPFVTLVDEIKESKQSYMYIFIEKENFRTRAKATQENLFRWLRAISKDDLECTVMLARKSHVLKFYVPLI